MKSFYFAAAFAAAAYAEDAAIDNIDAIVDQIFDKFDTVVDDDMLSKTEAEPFDTYLTDEHEFDIWEYGHLNLAGVKEFLKDLLVQEDKVGIYNKTSEFMTLAQGVGIGQEGAGDHILTRDEAYEFAEELMEVAMNGTAGDDYAITQASIEAMQAAGTINEHTLTIMQDYWAAESDTTLSVDDVLHILEALLIVNTSECSKFNENDENNGEVSRLEMMFNVLEEAMDEVYEN